MFETFGFETLTPAQAALYLALAIGAAFGILAEITRFCLRRAVVGQDKRQAGGVWLMALAVAILGTQAATALGWISFADHRFASHTIPVLAIVAGGLAFGGGMVLTRGCASRLAVLGASGNLRALTVLALFAIAAHATMKGLLAPVRTALSAPVIELPAGQLPLAAGLVLAVLALGFALRSGNRTGTLALSALIGLLVPLAWVGTGFVLFDEFDPIAMESLSFTAPAADTLFYVIASSAVDPRFGAGLVAGTLAGAALSALIAGRFRWQSFESPAQTGRYALGAVLMGAGGVLAGGCTLGAGLSGVPTLGISALLALAAIIAGARAMDLLLSGTSRESAGSPATPAALPAE